MIPKARARAGRSGRILRNLAAPGNTRIRPPPRAATPVKAALRARLARSSDLSRIMSYPFPETSPFSVQQFTTRAPVSSIVSTLEK